MQSCSAIYYGFFWFLDFHLDRRTYEVYCSSLERRSPGFMLCKIFFISYFYSFLFPSIQSSCCGTIMMGWKRNTIYLNMLIYLPRWSICITLLLYPQNSTSSWRRFRLWDQTRVYQWRHVPCTCPLHLSITQLGFLLRLFDAMPVGIEAWIFQIPPITRGWLILSVLTSLAVVSSFSVYFEYRIHRSDCCSAMSTHYALATVL